MTTERLVMVTKTQRRVAAKKRRKSAQVRHSRTNIAMGDSWKKATHEERQKALKQLKKDLLEARKDRHKARRDRRDAEKERKKAFNENREADHVL